MSQTIETAAMLVSQTNSVRIELFSYVNAFLFPSELTWLLASRVKTPHQSPKYISTLQKAIPCLLSEVAVKIHKEHSNLIEFRGWDYFYFRFHSITPFITVNFFANPLTSENRCVFLILPICLSVALNRE